MPRRDELLGAPTAGRRKRARVPEGSRKRVARACGTCRRVKERCEGGVPCKRCVRLQRRCEQTNATINANQKGDSSMSESQRKDFLDPDRIIALETIVKRYVRLSDLSTENLVKLVHSLDESKIATISGQNCDDEVGTMNDTNDREDFQLDSVSPTTIVYTGELSHQQFSNYVQRKLNTTVVAIPREYKIDASLREGSTKALQLYSQSLNVRNAVSLLPPLEVSDFLAGVFFKYAQTNYFFVDGAWLSQKIRICYSDSHRLESQDASWVCVVLMVLAIATQFAHLSECEEQRECLYAGNGESEVPVYLDDEIGLEFYRAASKLIPDVILLASLESVQAFLLLGVFTLPIDAAGLSSTYLGVAIKMAISNGMHRKLHRDLHLQTTELRNRTWWTACVLEKRVCVLHGRPVSISNSVIDAELPTHSSVLHTLAGVDDVSNILAMIRLTVMLEEARDKISELRRSSRQLRLTHLTSLLRLKNDLCDYWNKLPNKTFCKDMTTRGPLLRYNIHLALTYHLVHVFIGRSFIFSIPEVDHPYEVSLNSGPNFTEGLCSLVADCARSALDIIDLCQVLKDNTGLARASYSEFTSCRAALHVIIAQRTRGKNSALEEATEIGMKLIKDMSLGFYSTGAEKGTLEAMNEAICQLENSCECRDAAHSEHRVADDTAYNRFRTWAALWKAKDGTPTNSVAGQTRRYADFFNSANTESTIDDPISRYDFDADFCCPMLPVEMTDFPDFNDSWFNWTDPVQ